MLDILKDLLAHSLLVALIHLDMYVWANYALVLINSCYGRLVLAKVFLAPSEAIYLVQPGFLPSRKLLSRIRTRILGLEGKDDFLETSISAQFWFFVPSLGHETSLKQAMSTLRAKGGGGRFRSWRKEKVVTHFSLIRLLASSASEAAASSFRTFYRALMFIQDFDPLRYKMVTLLKIACMMIGS